MPNSMGVNPLQSNVFPQQLLQISGGMNLPHSVMDAHSSKPNTYPSQTYNV
jgi:hypothetical protein